MEKFTITITREFGSLGRSIARELSQILGVEFYDRDIVEEVANKLNLPVSTVSNEEEKSRHSFLPRMFPLGTDEEYMQDIIFDVQKDIILNLAKKTSCILVGRCSDFLLEKEKNNINIFIYASYEKRLQNCVDTLGMTESEAKRMILSVDRARNAYHKKYAGYLPGDPEHKQLMIDSSLLGVTGTAKLIAEIVHQLFES
ncbi:cytidylate kinase [Lacrimispora xylanisolvens]|jgi:cytidylate kinase|uniref:Cytidylate kinase n=1 Tax=Lacrimispora xylanisolvens TaxID=384636 RepID=A0A2S6HYM9_9FIRM|nr:cytidylate kinase-like family protein [Hungatella xylanolytica]MBE5986263.1 cytidylate kinase-like family protein [Paenibacillaceae bacterium]PPK83271.1 cytidylate kinase [Hungatella xylanolytica]